MPKTHICILTTAHPIDDVRVNAKIAQSFLAAGFRVSWVGPDFAFFDDQSPRTTAIEFHLLSRRRRRIDRLMAPMRVLPIAKLLNDVDVYFSPEPDSAMLALRLARRNGAKVIFDLHEVYHGPLLNRWLGRLNVPWIREFVRGRIARICRRSDLVLGVSNGVLDFYAPPSPRRLVVRSCAPAWFAGAPPANVHSAERSKFTLIHGKRMLQRGTLFVLQGMALAARTAPNLRVVMFNHVAPEHDPEYPAFVDAVEKLGLKEIVDLRDGVAMQEMPAVLRECDAGLIAYGKELGSDSLPNRIFEYMAAGLPVLVPRYAREMVSIVEAERCGLTVDFEDSSDVERAILHLWANPEECRRMGLRGRAAFELRHNWQTEFQPVIDQIKLWAITRNR